MTNKKFEYDNTTPLVTNVAGGKQSQLNLRLDLIDPNALFRMAAILKLGAEKYGENNWRKIPVNDHINHAVGHLYQHLGISLTAKVPIIAEDHLGHALCRVMFATALDKEMTRDDAKEKA